MEHLVSHEDLFLLIGSANRYAMGRHSYITKVAQDWTRRYWHHLASNEREILIRDLSDELERVTSFDSTLGDEDDHVRWASLLTWMKENP